MAFYKVNPDVETPTQSDIFVGPNYVYAPTFSLIATDRETYTYPIDGWYWFDTDAEAYAFFGIN